MSDTQTLSTAHRPVLNIDAVLRQLQDDVARLRRQMDELNHTALTLDADLSDLDLRVTMLGWTGNDPGRGTLPQGDA